MWGSHTQGLPFNSACAGSHEKHCLIALKLHHTTLSPGGLLKTQIPGLHSQISDLVSLQLGPGPTFLTHWSRWRRSCRGSHTLRTTGLRLELRPPRTDQFPLRTNTSICKLYYIHALVHLSGIYWEESRIHIFTPLISNMSTCTLTTSQRHT